MGKNLKAQAAPFFISTILVALTVYFVNEIRGLDWWWQAGIVILAGYLSFRSSHVIDFLDEKNKNWVLDRKFRELKNQSTKRGKELSELREVIVSFMEHSEIYRERVKDHLDIREDYLCIVKSSEGLSKVWNAMEKKSPLPFTQVLMDLPGSVMPFERIDLFLVPTRNLSDLDPGKVNEFIESNIIPKVERRRREFLKKQTAEIAALADPFSYKYIAFILNKRNVFYSLRNRKFNQAFHLFLVNEQLLNDFKDLKNELADVVKTKDILGLVKWSSFAELNADQAKIVDTYKKEINSSLRRHKISTFPDLGNLSIDQLTQMLLEAFGDGLTEKRTENIAVKVLDGANRTLDVLRANGVKL